MVLISHRGNIFEIKKELENTHTYIDQAIDAGFDVEIDVWQTDRLYLGHDGPEHPVDIEWLLDRKEKLWVHTKNFSALNDLITTPLRTFYHCREMHTIINSCNLIWSHDLAEAGSRSIIPLLSKEESQQSALFAHVYGICSDFIGDIA